MSTRKLVECDLCNEQLTTKEVDIRPREYALIIRFRDAAYQKPEDTIKYRDLCDECLREIKEAIRTIVLKRADRDATIPQKST